MSREKKISPEQVGLFTEMKDWCWSVRYELTAFLQQTRLRHIVWPLIRLRFWLFWTELHLNRGWKVDEFHPGLRTDDLAYDYLRPEERERYFFELGRLRYRACEQEFRDVRKHFPAKPGWLWFKKPPPASNYFAH